jgi:hypothetical protein
MTENVMVFLSGLGVGVTFCVFGGFFALFLYHLFRIIREQNEIEDANEKD